VGDVCRRWGSASRRSTCGSGSMRGSASAKCGNSVGRKRPARSVSVRFRGCCRWRGPPCGIRVIAILRRRCECTCVSWPPNESASVTDDSRCCYTRQLAREREADLSTLYRGSADGADQSASEAGSAALRAAGCGDRAEPAVEYELYERASRRRPVVSDLDGRGSVHAGMSVLGGRSVPQWENGRAGVAAGLHAARGPACDHRLDIGGQFASWVMDAWACRHGI
jgi:hypothetical protein